MAASAPRVAYLAASVDGGMGAWAYLVVNEDETLTRRSEFMKYPNRPQVVVLTCLHKLLLENDGDLVINSNEEIFTLYFVEHYPKWLQNGFRNRRRKIIFEVDLVRSIGDLMKNRNVTFIKPDYLDIELYLREVITEAWYVRTKGIMWGEDKKIIR